MSTEPETRNENQETRETLAAYRADRDDFPRLLYLLFQEIQVRKEAGERSAT